MGKNIKEVFEEFQSYVNNLEVLVENDVEYEENFDCFKRFSQNEIFINNLRNYVYYLSNANIKHLNDNIKENLYKELDEYQKYEEEDYSGFTD